MCIRDSAATIRNAATPVFCGSALRNRGIQRVLDGVVHYLPCLLYTSDAADERSSVDLGGRRIIKKKNITTS